MKDVCTGLYIQPTVLLPLTRLNTKRLLDIYISCYYKTVTITDGYSHWDFYYCIFPDRPSWKMGESVVIGGDPVQTRRMATQLQFIREDTTGLQS
jgi:hypothetical protein